MTIWRRFNIFINDKFSLLLLWSLLLLLHRPLVSLPQPLPLQQLLLPLRSLQQYHRLLHRLRRHLRRTNTSTSTSTACCATWCATCATARTTTTAWPRLQAATGNAITLLSLNSFFINLVLLQKYKFDIHSFLHISTFKRKTFNIF